ncbi:MAG: Rsd/AlgQ family anti-sigma factor [Halioglobus sp.]|nr:Rsd/AlgQ family anti-sigma factor [Halioglobus sp.]
MPQDTRNPAAQFEAVDELLTAWLRERREVLGKYTEIVVMLDANIDGAAQGERQTALCGLLVDYCSAGHFEVFHHLLDEAESFGDGSSVLGRELIPSIGDTTEVILAYEEKYGAGNSDAPELERDLSALGEVLESRFQLEDRLIAGMHNRHRRLVEAPQPG